jgi:hypothetical protein
METEPRIQSKAQLLLLFRTSTNVPEDWQRDACFSRGNEQ